MAHVPEGFWDNLLDYVQDRIVIPVIGTELVTVRAGEREELYAQIHRMLRHAALTPPESLRALRRAA